MSVKAVAWALQQKIASRSLKAALLSIAGRCDAAGVTTVGQATLAEDLGVTVRHVKRHLQALEWLGIIDRTMRSNGARGRATDLIRLNLTSTFTVTKEDLPNASRASRKGTSAPPSKASQGDIAPHLAQGDTHVTPIREYISTGSAEPKRGLSDQGGEATRRRAKQSKLGAPVDSLAPTFGTPPSGKDLARRSKARIYARHKAALDLVSRGTVH